MGRGVASGFKRLSHQDSVLFCNLHGRQTSAGRPVCVCVCEGAGGPGGLVLQGEPG